MNWVVKYIGITVLIISCLACKRSLRDKEYVQFLQSEESGLLKSVKLSDWQFDMQYKPYDYIVLLESKGDKNFDKVKRLKNLEGTAWFNISFKRIQSDVSPLRYNVTSQEEYNTRLNYYLSAAPRDIALVYDKDTLKPMSYLFETNYNLTPQETMVVGFALPDKATKPEKDMQLIYIDRVFDNGIIKATYNSNKLKNIPDLKY